MNSIQLYKMTLTILQISFSKYYITDVQEQLDKVKVHLSILMGTWHPTGKLAKLGVHPQIGIQMGSKKKRWNYDFAMDIGFANSPNTYQAVHKEKGDTLTNTCSFTNYYVAGEIGYDILS